MGNEEKEVRIIGNTAEAARFAADLAAMISTRTEDDKEVVQILHTVSMALLNPYAILIDANILIGEYSGLVRRSR